MFPDLSIIVPYWPSTEHRRRLLNWNLNRYYSIFPRAEVCIGQQRTMGPFCLAECRNDGASLATRPNLLFADADVIAFPRAVRHGLAQLATSGHARVFPYDNYHHLSEQTTHALLGLDPTTLLEARSRNPTQLVAEASYPDSTSGLVLITKEMFDRSGRFDERFKGWGPEDQAWDLAVDTLCGTSGRVDIADLYHLWHPKPAELTTDNPDYRASCDLWDRYKAAAGDPHTMRALVEEWSGDA